MAAECGFDMVPRLTDAQSDGKRWHAFIDDVRESYKEDPVVHVRSHSIEFDVGEHPSLPLDGRKFQQFSSNVNEPSTQAAESYIDRVCRIARKYFDSRIRFWHEARRGNDYYNDEKEATESPQRTAAPLNKVQQFKQPGDTSKPYSVEALPGKGLALVAAQNISKGTRILSEKPLFTFPSAGPNIEEIEQVVTHKLKALPRDDQRAVLSLHNNFRGRANPFIGIVKTNGIPLGPGATEGGLFLETARINHACLPNSQHTWNANIEQETVHAVKDIGQGEEITIMYTNGPSESRQRRLKNAFGFECTCDLCRLPEADRLASDRRLEEIQRLDAFLSDGHRLIASPESCLQDAHTLLRLLEAEVITDARLARLYYDAIQVAIAHEDKARGKVFAERAYATRLCCEGEDSPETLKTRDLAANPARHPSFGLSQKWKQSEKLVPTSLKSEDFEAWLWRRESRIDAIL